MCRTKLVPLATFEPEHEQQQQGKYQPKRANTPESHTGSENQNLSDSDCHCNSPHPEAAPVAQYGRHGKNNQQRLPAPSRKGLSSRFRDIKPWKIIELPEDVACHATFPAGFTVEVYDGHLTQHFIVNSEEVVPTVGALSYVEHYNETGPYSRFRFQLCHNYACGRCAKGFNCTYLHLNQLSNATCVHIQGGNYEMMPAGVNLFVHTPHSSSPPQVVPSEYLIQTQGAIAMMQSVLEGKEATVQRPQHCAHFQYKRMCNRGYECNFIHSTVAAPR